MWSARLLLLLLGCTCALQPGGSLRAVAPSALICHPIRMQVGGVTVTPLFDQVLVEVQREPAASLGGILMPSAFSEDDEALYEDAFGKKENLVGTVIAVGPGHPAENGKLVPIYNLEVGMKVVIAAVDGIKVEPQGKSDCDSMFFLYNPDDLLFSASADANGS